MTSLIRWSWRRRKKQQVKAKPLPAVILRKDGDGKVEISSLMDPTAEDEDEYYFEDPSNIGMKPVLHDIHKVKHCPISPSPSDWSQCHSIGPVPRACEADAQGEGEEV